MIDGKFEAKKCPENNLGQSFTEKGPQQGRVKKPYVAGCVYECV